MNILTPTVVGDAVFTSSHQKRSGLYSVTKAERIGVPCSCRRVKPTAFGQP